MQLYNVPCKDKNEQTVLYIYVHIYYILCPTDTIGAYRTNVAWTVLFNVKQIVVYETANKLYLSLYNTMVFIHYYMYKPYVWRDYIYIYIDLHICLYPSPIAANRPSSYNICFPYWSTKVTYKTITHLQFVIAHHLRSISSIYIIKIN